MGTLKDPARVMKRAGKLASRDKSRAILNGVHLDECGDVVSTDSYRMYIEHKKWDGPSIDVPAGTVSEIAKQPVKTESAEIEQKETVVSAELSNGKRFSGNVPSGTYPDYKRLMGMKVNTSVTVEPKLLMPILNEHARRKAPVRLDVDGSKLTVSGMGDDKYPFAEFEDACEGNDTAIAVNPAYLKDVLKMAGKRAEIRIESHHKPMSVCWDDIEVIVMPVRIDEPKEAKEEPMKARAPKNVNRDEVKEAVYRRAIDRAAADEDSRVSGGNATESERTLVWHLEKDGRLTVERYGETWCSWTLDGEFLCCIEQGRSKRKVHLHYPMTKPKLLKEDKVAELRARDEAERAAKEKAGVDVKVEVTEHADVTAVEIEPKKQEEPMKEEKMDEMGKRIEELEAALKAAEAKASMWEKKAQEYFDSKPEPATEQEPEPKVEMPTEVRLATLKAWAKGKELLVTQKNPTACIWVEGNSKPYADELDSMGLRFSKKRKSWYYKQTGE